MRFTNTHMDNVYKKRDHLESRIKVLNQIIADLDNSYTLRVTTANAEDYLFIKDTNGELKFKFKVELKATIDELMFINDLVNFIEKVASLNELVGEYNNFLRDEVNIGLFTMVNPKYSNTLLQEIFKKEK